MASTGAKRLALVLSGLTFLAACEEGANFNPFDKPLFQKEDNAADEAVEVQATGATSIEQDVEAPEVFAQTDDGLWDGRPSLGGVWVAHSDVTAPERVMIRNEANGKFVIGALFRRERENPGPRFQVSSDAAASLGMLAGSPSNLDVVALRRKEIAVVPDEVIPAVDTIEAPVEIEEKSLDPVAAMAESAIAEATAGASAAPAAAPEAVKTTALAATATPQPKSSLKRPFLQIGIFSIEGNANNTSDLLRKQGVIPTIIKSSSNGKVYWRVIVGPASSTSERAAVLKKVKDLGFPDAYAVTN